MKLSFAIAVLLGVVVAQDKKAVSTDATDPESKKILETKPKDYFSDDPRAGTSSMPVARAPGSSLAKPAKKFEIPENTQAEPALSTTTNPREYSSGSGKTYHDKVTTKVADEPLKKPDTPAGINESTETAGTTHLWKVNSGDSPDPPKEDKKEEKTPESHSFLQMEESVGCEPAIDVSQKQLDIELDYFSRNFDYKHYKKAMQIYKEMQKQGKDPKVSIHTWELYDAAFSFPRVRRYDLVQKHMDLIQHFQDNLNENFSNRLHVDNFIRVAKNAQNALNEKYHNGEFSDPADYDPEADHPVTWATAVI